MEGTLQEELQDELQEHRTPIDPNRTRWFMPLRLWREASRRQRLAVILPPLIAPSLFFFTPYGAAMLGAAIVLTCTVVFVFRLLLQPFRFGQPAHLRAWRAPVAAAGAIGTMMLFNLASSEARFAARDLALDLQRGVAAWPCGDEDRCSIRAGFTWADFLVQVSRDRTSLEPTQRVFFYLGPDTSTEFVATPNHVQARSYIDNDVYELDLDTLLRLPNART